MKAAVFALLGGLASFNPAIASDHIDGPITTRHRVADLTDFYAFPTPGKAGSLSLVLNTYPLVPKHGHFADRANYAIIIRKATLPNSGSQLFGHSDEIVLNCSFVTPRDHVDHRVSCRTTNGLRAENHYNRVNGQSGGDFKLFAGMRTDPFFFDSDFAKKASEGRLIQSAGSNTMTKVNVLSIAIEIDVAKLYPNSQVNLLAVASASYTRDSANSPLRILDRVGRPEVTNVSMFTPPNEAELRDRYNADRPFAISEDARTAYESRLVRNITHYDNLDNTPHLTASQKQSIARMLTHDFLVLDITKPCNGDNFLEIEKAVLNGTVHQTCGGRKITDDIMDTLYSLYIKGFSGERVSDRVDAPAQPVSSNFPYLGSPDLSLAARLKAKAAKLLLGIPEDSHH